MIRVTDRIALDEAEIEERFVRAEGPGGQHVNKTSSAVELRFNAASSPALTPAVFARLARLAGRRMTQEGVVVIRAQSHRAQERNRADALARLVALIAEAAVEEKPRRATRTPRAERERRMEGKARRGRVKSLRGRVRED
ncbi:MAG: alternative ribosome rescue aminoacyl-tRNA hydrolase ArfB [Hyphomonadaceae bacterium]